MVPGAGKAALSILFLFAVLPPWGMRGRAAARYRLHVALALGHLALSPS
jgi:hypothetical protein